MFTLSHLDEAKSLFCDVKLKNTSNPQKKRISILSFADGGSTSRKDSTASK
jgi:hypothetical protein